MNKDKGLIPPLPEGSRRKRNERDDEIPVTQESTRSSMSLTLSRTAVAKAASRIPVATTSSIPNVIPVPIFSNTDSHISGHVDGACRGNGTRQAHSSIGVFFASYDNPYNVSERVSEPTNNRAELRALIRFYQRLYEIRQTFPHIQSADVHTDSAYVCSGVLEGRTNLPYDHGHANSDLWVLLGEAMNRVLDILINIRWVPRHQNRASDELCNAALDQRPANTLITNTTSSPYSSVTLNRCLQLITTRRIRTIRYIPRGLEIQFTAVIESITQRTVDAHEKRIMFIILPHLLSFYTKHCNNQQLYKHLRSHLSMLTDESYFNEHLLLLSELPDYIDDPSPPVAMTPERVTSLCRNGAFHKCIQLHDVVVEDQPTAAILQRITEQAFQTQPLPTPLPTIHVSTTSAECFSAFRRLKSHKASTLTGWTKELLYHVVTAIHLRPFVVEVLTAIINAHLTDPELLMFRTSIAMILKYRNKDKRRTCILGDVLLKWGWHLVLRNTVKKDVNFASSPNTFGSSNQCQVSIHCVQKSIEEGNTPVHMDAVSAFPTVCRTAAFDYVRSRGSIYERAFPLMNMMYAARSTAVVFCNGHIVHTFTASTGSHQGCVSGGYIHAFGTLRASLKFPSEISQVWDDVTILRPASGLTAKVIAAYAACRQDLSGPKLQTLTGSALPARILGGIVLHPSTDHRYLAKAPAVHDTLVKVTLTYNNIRTLDASLQCKILIIKSVQWNWQYYLETWHPLAGEILARHIDSEQTSTFYQLFPTLRTLLDEERDPARDILLHHPTEDGGIGLLPFESLQPYFYAKSRNLCAPQAAHKFRFDIRCPPHLSNGPMAHSVQGIDDSKPNKLHIP